VENTPPHEDLPIFTYCGIDIGIRNATKLSLNAANVYQWEGYVMDMSNHPIDEHELGGSKLHVKQRPRNPEKSLYIHPTFPLPPFWFLRSMQARSVSTGMNAGTWISSENSQCTNVLNISKTPFGAVLFTKFWKPNPQLDMQL
jgi:hypothetical protein